jgi:hypothetical protein
MKWLNRMGQMGVVMCLLTALTPNVFALEEVGVEITADYLGKYIWRGQNLSDDPVFQPGVSMTYEGFTFGIWGNLETTSINNNSGEFTEVDQYLDYSSEVPDIEGLGFSLGLIYYDFPGTTVPRTTEVYWGLNLDTLLSPSITFNHDIDEADGLYVSLGLGHSVDKIFELDPDTPVAMELGASYGWGDSSYNQYYWGLNNSKANDLAFSASFPFEIGGWTINPSINYIALVSSDIKKTNAYGRDDDFLFVGIGFSKGF